MTSFWITLVPFVALFVLLIPLRRPAYQAAPIAYALTVAIALFGWELTGGVLAASVANALIVFVELLLIVVFALLVLNVMIETGALDTVKTAIGGITSDLRVLAMLLAWGLVGFIEGIAGFGTPAVIAAPVLVYFGLKPLRAVAVCLIGNSTAVPFGAAGTPVVIGFAGLGVEPEVIADATLYAALVQAVASILITASITYVVTFDAGKGSFRAFLPFAVFAALAFSLPYLAVAYLVGPELPAIIGGIVALVLIAYAAKRGFLLPQHGDDLAMASGDDAAAGKPEPSPASGAIWRSFAPFIVMSLALVVSRTAPGVQTALQDVTLGFGTVAGIEIETFTPLYTPYFYLALALATALLVLPIDQGKLESAVTATYGKVRTAAVVLVFVIALTQLLLVSGTNPANLPSMPEVLGEGLADRFGDGFVVISAFVGALGSFMTGSATVSNLLFASLQQDTALALAQPVAIVLALQLIGAAVGNLISLSNIAMAAGAVGLDAREGEVIRLTLVPVVVICLTAGLAFAFW
ncbi:MAG: L-lactate permease [Geminicoccaceae bacterium]|nr:MAG: L-lactate permease [Geminicoccaceae bacterium]